MKKLKIISTTASDVKIKAIESVFGEKYIFDITPMSTANAELPNQPINSGKKKKKKKLKKKIKKK